MATMTTTLPTTTLAPPTLVTPEDFLRMPDTHGYELVDGVLVEKHAVGFSSLVNVRISVLLAQFLDKRNPGLIFDSEAAYQCFPESPGMIRKPDVSLAKAGRIPDEQLRKGFIRVPPDLAVEVLSPNDLAFEIDRKIGEYLRAGVREVWVVNPEERTVRIHRHDGTLAELHDGDTITAEEILPGFSCFAREFFPTL